MICSVIGKFTLLRKADNPFYLEYIATLVKNIEELIGRGYTSFMSEIVHKYDKDIYAAVEMFNNQFGNISFEGVIPYRTKKEKKTREVIFMCKKIHYVTDSVRSKGVARISRKFMIDNSDATLFIWNGKKQSEIWNAIKYAEKLGKEVFLINISSFKGDIVIFS